MVPWVLLAVASRRVAGEAVVGHDASMGRRVRVTASPAGVSQLWCLLGPPRGDLSVLGEGSPVSWLGCGGREASGLGG